MKRLFSVIFQEKEKLNTVKILDSLASYKFKLSKTPNKTKLVSKIFNSSFNFFCRNRENFPICIVALSLGAS